MEPNKFLELGEDSLGERVTQNVSKVAETGGRQVDAAVDYMDKAKGEVTESLERIKEEGWKGLKQKAIDSTRQEPLKALALAATAGLLLAWVIKTGK